MTKHDLHLARIFPRLFVASSILILPACLGHDPYITKFPHVALGDSRDRVIELMGQPDFVNSVEVPLMKAEQFAWRAPGKGRVYLVLLVMGRTAAKFSVE